MWGTVHYKLDQTACNNNVFISVNRSAFNNSLVLLSKKADNECCQLLNLMMICVIIDQCFNIHWLNVVSSNLMECDPCYVNYWSFSIKALNHSWAAPDAQRLPAVSAAGGLTVWMMTQGGSHMSGRMVSQGYPTPEWLLDHFQEQTQKRSWGRRNHTNLNPSRDWKPDS